MKKTLIVMSILAVILTACLPGQTPEETQAQVNTAVAAAFATQQHLVDQAVASTLTAVAQNAPPAGLTPINTPLSFPTLTPIIPTVTPLVLNTPSSGGSGGGGGGSGSGGGGGSSTKYSCAIIAEKPYDGASFKPGDSFDKSWTIKNTGTAAWGADWDFEYIKGEDMSPTGDRSIGQEVKPGKSITMLIEVTAPDITPKESGKTFVMTWSLNNGTHFCTPYVAIRVVYPGSQP
jgi:type II secretory pathway pseudopilin PulG